MQYVMDGKTPLGEVLMAADEEGLAGLWFVGQRHFAPFIDGNAIRRDLPIFDETSKWLEDYFSGNTPTYCPALHLMGTPFQKRVWSILCTIPYGQTMTYGRIAALVASPSEARSPATPSRSSSPAIAWSLHTEALPAMPEDYGANAAFWSWKGRLPHRALCECVVMHRCVRNLLYPVIP